jgi:hypothetical protein
MVQVDCITQYWMYTASGLQPSVYRIAGNFRGVQFLRMVSLQSFRGLIFADEGDHAHYTLYNRTYFAGLFFADSRLSAKNAKIGPHKNSRYAVYVK